MPDVDRLTSVAARPLPAGDRRTGCSAHTCQRMKLCTALTKCLVAARTAYVATQPFPDLLLDARSGRWLSQQFHAVAIDANSVTAAVEAADVAELLGSLIGSFFVPCRELLMSPSAPRPANAGASTWPASQRAAMSPTGHFRRHRRQRQLALPAAGLARSGRGR